MDKTFCAVIGDPDEWWIVQSCSLWFFVGELFEAIHLDFQRYVFPRGQFLLPTPCTILINLLIFQTHKQRPTWQDPRSYKRCFRGTLQQHSRKKRRAICHICRGRGGASASLHDPIYRNFEPKGRRA